MATEKPEPLPVTLKNAILAQCHECLGHYTDGLQDCENRRCSLYSWMPYRKLEPDLSWTQWHPKRIGKVIRTKKLLSEAEKAALREKLNGG